jgi:hypothetical protein
MGSPIELNKFWSDACEYIMLYVIYTFYAYYQNVKSNCKIFQFPNNRIYQMDKLIIHLKEAKGTYTRKDRYLSLQNDFQDSRSWNALVHGKKLCSKKNCVHIPSLTE